MDLSTRIGQVCLELLEAFSFWCIAVKLELECQLLLVRADVVGDRELEAGVADFLALLAVYGATDGLGAYEPLSQLDDPWIAVLHTVFR